MSNVLTKQIRERIEAQGENTLYMVRDFADLNNDGLVTPCFVSLGEGRHACENITRNLPLSYAQPFWYIEAKHR